MANYCKKCGSELPEGVQFCPKCGASLKNEEGASVGLKILSVLIPLAGWIMYFVFKDENRKKALDCSNFAWIGFLVNGLLSLLAL